MEKKNNSEMEKQFSEILGWGQELDILIGVKEDGKPDVKRFHFTPVSLSDLPKLMTNINKFSESASNGNFSEESVNVAAEIIHMSTKRMHPDWTIEMLKDKFGLVGLAKSIKCIMDINDFLTEMQGINQVMTKVTM
jgi:predicted glycosyltransferase